RNQLLTMRSQSPGGPPTSTSVLGADDANNTYSMLYTDDRGVVRQYAMALTRAKWTIERKAPRFSQRFIGTFSRDRRVIRGACQQSLNGRNWKHDFQVTYKKRR